VTGATSKFIDSLQRSWLLKLAWVLAPFAPMLVVATSKHSPERWAGWLSSAMLLVVFGSLAASYAFALIERRQRRARLRALSPLQRLQMSDEANLAPLGETLRVTDHPAIETLPRVVQWAIAALGAPLPKPLSAVVVALDLSIFVLLLAMVFLNDPMGQLSRRLGAPLLPYWPIFIALFAGLVALRLIERLSSMNRYYIAQAATSGRRPFPAL